MATEMMPHIITFLGVATLIVLTHAGVILLVRRSKQRERLAGDGFLVLAEWRPYTRHVVSLFYMAILIVPIFLFLSALVMGGVLAAFESWSYQDGVYYVLTNVAGLVFPPTDVTPETTVGDIIDLIISTWALLLMASAMGVVGSMQLTAVAVSAMSPSRLGLLKHLAVTFPLFLLIISAIIGAVIAGIEDWPFIDGFFFVTGKLCGLVTPLTDETVQSDGGHFVETLSFFLELTIGGAVVGTVAGHPAVLEMLESIEGKMPEEGDAAPKADSTTLPEEGLPPAVPASMKDGAGSLVVELGPDEKEAEDDLQTCWSIHKAQM